MSNDHKKQADTPADEVRTSGARPFLIALFMASVIAAATFLGSRAWLPDGIVPKTDLPLQPSV
ncbi:MAG: hypothetical protein ACPHF4_09750, partial [Rubripirellula sp.]